MNAESMLPDDGNSDPRPDSGGSKARPRWPYFMAIAAGTLLAVLQPWRVPVPPPEGFPKPITLDDGSNVTPGAAHEPAPGEPTPLTPAGRIPARPDVFTFQLGEGKKRHVVQLYDAEGQLKWKSGEVESATCPLPGSVALEEGRYFWRVVSLPAAGADPKNGIPSPLVEFELYHP